MKRAEPGTQQSKQDSRKDTASGLREPRRWTEDEDTILRRETQAQCMFPDLESARGA